MAETRHYIYNTELRRRTLLTDQNRNQNDKANIYFILVHYTQMFSLPLLKRLSMARQINFHKTLHDGWRLFMLLAEICSQN